MRLKPIALLFGFALLSASIGYSQAPSFEWVVSAATSSGGYGVAHDDLGNVYVTGRFTGTVDFDPGAGVSNLTSAGGLDTYITKVDAAGNLVWARRVGGPNDVYSFDVSVDDGGNVYITGAFSGTADFDPGPGTFNLSSIGLFFDEIFVLKLDVNGDLAWARKMGSSDFDFGRSIAVSAAGNVITTGSFQGTVDFDPGAGTSTLTSTSGGNDIFISKLDASGNFVWARRLGGSGNDIGYSVTVDAAENVFTTGSFSSTADFDPGLAVFNLTGVSSGDIFVSKLDGAGNFVWAKGMGGTSSDIGHSIQVDPAGNVYTSGEFHTTVDFDPGSGTANLVSMGFNDAFISKLDASGNYLWAKGIGGTIDDESSGLALDVYGNVYATGSFESTVDFDPGPGTFNLTASSSGGFAVKLDGFGDFVWAQAFAGSTHEGIDVDVFGSIYSTGRFSGTVDFDGGPGVFNVTSVGTNNAFIHKMRQPPTPPTISSFSPTSGPVGTTVIIVGTNFSTTPVNNIVYFGAVRATVTAATPTQLTVTVPAGATYQPLTVNVSGFNAYSSTPFVVTFCGGSGITTSSFASPIKLITEPSAGPVSVFNGDLDGDGKPDLVVANRFANTVSVFRNISTGIGNITYAPKIDLATGFEPISISMGDLDGDGKGDLAVAIFGEFKVSVFLNTSSGPGNISFAPKVDFLTGPAGAGPFSVAVGDLDQDGKSDLAVANLLNHQLSVLRNISSGIGNTNFSPRIDFPTGAGSGPISIAIRDLDGDAKTDLVSANANNNRASVFRSTSSGPGVISFAARVDLTTGTEPRAVYIGDLDSDGKADLAVANSSASNSVSVFRNTSNVGSISFTLKQDFIVSTSPWDVSIADLDGDGKVDLVTANGGSSAFASVLRNSSTGAGNINFDTRVDFLSGTNPVSVSVGDFDLDGKNDLALANFNGDEISVFRNNVSVATAPTITSFSPTSGSVGTFVTIFGTNFNQPFPSDVTFNGISTPILDFTSSSISVDVPLGATTGPIEATVGCITATSSSNFVIGLSTISITLQPTDAIVCEGAPATFSTNATGTTNITYQWQFSPDGIAPFTDLVNNTNYSGATNAMLSVNTAGNFGEGRYRCRINGDFASEVVSNGAILSATFCNQPPSIIAAKIQTTLEATEIIKLSELISDPDGNLDLSTLKVTEQPISGAPATIDAQYQLVVDYARISFSGPDELTIEVCDFSGVCVQQKISIEVIGEIVIYNGISPNGDEANDFWEILYIDVIADTKNNKVSLFNRWGDMVWEANNYDNKEQVFKGLNKNGNEIPSGTYFYKIEFASGQKTQMGYISLKR